MADAVPGAGSSMRYGKLNKIPKLAKTILIVVVIGVVAYFIWNHFHNNSSNSSMVTPAQEESMAKKYSNQYLNSKDYTSYQLDRQDLANKYLANNDTANAERVMNEVLANMPPDNITSASYSMLYRIEKAKGDATLEKKYLGLMITKLKAEGNNATAAAAQHELDSLK